MRRLLLALIGFLALLQIGHAQTVPTTTTLPAQIDRAHLAAVLGTKADTVNPSMSGTFNVSGIGGPITIKNIGTVEPANGVFLTSAGNAISYCSIDGCVAVGSDHQRATGLFVSTTGMDGQAQENTVGIETTINKGAATVWAASTAYAFGVNVTNLTGDYIGVYRATQAGTSAVSGLGPQGKTASITDGSVVWQWINDSAIDAKVGLYNAVHVQPGAGASWAQANNMSVDTGASTGFMANTEMDLVNNAGNCVVGVGNCYDLLMGMGGSGTSTAFISMSGSGQNANPSVYQTHYGLLMSGKRLASDADIADGASGNVGLLFNVFSNASHANASIVDNSTGGASYIINGTHSVATIEDRSVSPTSVSVEGTHSVAGFYENSTTPNGFIAAGTYIGSDFFSHGASPFAFSAGGHHTTASLATTGDTAPLSLSAGAGQKVCFNASSSCVYYSTSKHKWYFTSSTNAVVASIDNSGNLITKGTVTPGGTP